MIHLAVLTQFLAILFFFLAFIGREQKSSSKHEPEPEVSVGQCYEYIMDLGDNRSLVKYRYVTGLKAGYVEFNEVSCREVPESASRRVDTIESFLTKSSDVKLKLIPQKLDPFQP